jgi:hypothetical protein
MGIAVYLKDISKGVSNASALSQNAAHALMREVLEGGPVPPRVVPS